jgi:osmoprotectant transport system permease protein
MRRANIQMIMLPAAVAAFVALVSLGGIWRELLSPVYPDLDAYLYPRVGLWTLVRQHLVMVAISSGLSIIVGVGLGILVTRSFGRDFLQAVNSLVSVGQTFPPVAVLALAVPAVGFGAVPTIIALFLYGLLPIVRNTIGGLQAVSPAVNEAAKGMGMTELQSLARVELPLAFPVIMAGIRTSVVINIGTATIGATIGAGGLGAPIITGLASDNPAFILQGSIIAALFAIIADQAMEIIEAHTAPRGRV